VATLNIFDNQWVQLKGRSSKLKGPTFVGKRGVSSAQFIAKQHGWDNRSHNITSHNISRLVTPELATKGSVEVGRYRQRDWNGE
jgi:hypothetical protein